MLCFIYCGSMSEPNEVWQSASERKLQGLDWMQVVWRTQMGLWHNALQISGELIWNQTQKLSAVKHRMFIELFLWAMWNFGLLGIGIPKGWKEGILWNLRYWEWWSGEPAQSVWFEIIDWYNAISSYNSIRAFTGMVFAAQRVSRKKMMCCIRSVRMKFFSLCASKNGVKNVARCQNWH